MDQPDRSTSSSLNHLHPPQRPDRETTVEQLKPQLSLAPKIIYTNAALSGTLTPRIEA